MTDNKRGPVLIVDPPSGWKYGFPKVFDPKPHQSMKEWLYDEGYPLEECDFALRHLRTWYEDPIVEEEK